MRPSSPFLLADQGGGRVRLVEACGRAPLRYAANRVKLNLRISMLDYLAGGHTLEKFLEDFSTVRREQALELLRKLKELLATAQI